MSKPPEMIELEPLEFRTLPPQPPMTESQRRALAEACARGEVPTPRPILLLFGVPTEPSD
jgi:hypothetical protein